MPEIKLYMIVTNDEYETPVATDLKGAKAVADYLELSVNRVRKNICTGRWCKKAKYKAVVCGIYEADKQNYNKNYSMTHDRSPYYREYYQKTKAETSEKRKQYMRQYRLRRKEENEKCIG